MSEHEAPNKSLLTEHFSGSVVLGSRCYSRLIGVYKCTPTDYSAPPRPLVSFDQLNSSDSDRLSPWRFSFPDRFRVNSSWNSCSRAIAYYRIDLALFASNSTIRPRLPLHIRFPSAPVSPQECPSLRCHFSWRHNRVPRRTQRRLQSLMCRKKNRSPIHNFSKIQPP